MTTAKVIFFPLFSQLSTGNCPTMTRREFQSKSLYSQLQIGDRKKTAILRPPDSTAERFVTGRGVTRDFRLEQRTQSSIFTQSDRQTYNSHTFVVSL